MAAILTADLPDAEEFISEGLITSVEAPLKSGKEATTYLCRAHPSLGERYAVLKVYHELNRRNFANDTLYQEGRLILNGQVRRAVAAKTEFGRQAQSAIWVDHEYETLCTLADAGADVPTPFASNETAVLMAYAGDRSAPAPRLQDVHLSPAEAVGFRDRVLWNVETMLAADVVHGDLSAFNILAWNGAPLVIDFPQAVDPRFSNQARRLLDRDVANLERYFTRHGAAFNAASFVNDLWWRWTMGKLS